MSTTVINKNQVKVFTLLLLLGIIWGSGYSIARYAMTHGVPPLGYSFWQSIGPAIFLFIVAVIKEGGLHVSAHHFRYYIIAGLLGIALPNTNMYFAAPHLPAGILAVIVNTVPIMIYPLALAFKQENFHWGRISGVVVGVVGIMLIVSGDWHLATQGGINWILIALLTPLLFALCALYGVNDRPRYTSSLNLAAGMLLASAVLLTPMVLDTHQFYMIDSFSLLNLAILLEIVLSSVGYILFFQLLKSAGAVYYSLVGGVVAITGLVWGKILFDEVITLQSTLAILMIVLAIMIVTLLQRTQKVKTDD